MSRMEGMMTKVGRYPADEAGVERFLRIVEPSSNALLPYCTMALSGYVHVSGMFSDERAALADALRLFIEDEPSGADPAGIEPCSGACACQMGGEPC